VALPPLRQLHSLRHAGGRAHGPHPRSYDYTLPKKVRKLGLRVALSAKFAQGDLTFVDKVAVQTHKTKPLHEMLARRGLGKGCSALIVAGEEVDENLKRASLNLPYANVMASRGVCVDVRARRAARMLCCRRAAAPHASRLRPCVQGSMSTTA
jgi:large subunit ribosomal protein L4